MKERKKRKERKIKRKIKRKKERKKERSGRKEKKKWKKVKRKGGYWRKKMEKRGKGTKIDIEIEEERNRSNRIF